MPSSRSSGHHEDSVHECEAAPRRATRITTEFRLAMFGMLHPDEIEDLLFTRRVGHLACVVDDRPYIVPLSFAYDGGAIYAHTTPGRKVEAMRSRPAVAFEIEDLGDPRRWRSVIVEGMFEEVTGANERRQAERLLADVAAGMSPPRSEIVFRIRPTRKSGRWLRFATDP